MKVLVCGSRTYSNPEKVNKVLKEKSISSIIQGGARGADQFAQNYAWLHDIPNKTFKADWRRYGDGAGPRRNIDMLNTTPDLVIAFFDKKRTTGTAHTVMEAKKRGIPVEEHFD